MGNLLDLQHPLMRAEASWMMTWEVAAVTRALQRTFQVGAAAGLGAGRWALVRGEVTQRQWMAVTQMMRLTANMKPKRRQA
jgi:hypothetical protein